MDFLVRSPSLHMNTKCNRLSQFAWELCAPFPCLSGNPRHCYWPWPSSLSPSGWKDHHQLTSLACDDSPPHTHTQIWQSPGHKITALQARCTAGPRLCSAAVLHHSPCSAGWCRECRQDWTIRLDAAPVWTGRGQACCGAKPGSAGQSSSRSGPHQQQPHHTPPPLLLATFPPSQGTEAAESRSEMKIWQLWERGWETQHWFRQTFAAQIS